MPRSVSGNYTLPLPPVVSNTTIEAAWANTTDDDIAQALTDSLDRYGRGGMVAPFRLIDGSETIPAWAFAAETGTGLWRDGSGVLAVSVQGVKVGQWSAAGYSGVIVGEGGGDPVLLPDGTLAAPSLAFTNEPGLGIFRAAAGALGYVGTTHRFTGEVGVGSAPSAWAAGYDAINVLRMNLYGNSADATGGLFNNSYFDGANMRYVMNGASTGIHFSSGLVFHIAPVGVAGGVATSTAQFVMAEGGRFYGTALHNNPQPVTGAVNQYIASGTYTPTYANILNATGITANACQWMRVGNVVTVSGLVYFGTTATGSTSFSATLPIASNFTDYNHGDGVAARRGASSASDVARVYSDAATDLMVFSLSSSTTSNTECSFTFTYLVQ